MILLDLVIFRTGRTYNENNEPIWEADSILLRVPASNVFVDILVRQYGKAQLHGDRNVIHVEDIRHFANVARGICRMKQLGVSWEDVSLLLNPTVVNYYTKNGSYALLEEHAEQAFELLTYLLNLGVEDRLCYAHVATINQYND